MSHQAETIRAALAELPETCRYHGHEIEGRVLWRFAGACCATGEPSLRRRRALVALAELDDANQVKLARLAAARQALIQSGYFQPHEIGDDVAPRITELNTARLLPTSARPQLDPEIQEAIRAGLVAAAEEILQDAMHPERRLLASRSVGNPRAETPENVDEPGQTRTNG